MSDSKDNKKKGFFSRLFGGLSTPKKIENEVTKSQDSVEIPTKSALNKMKKADIVDVAKENGLDLDINLTKAKLLEALDLHFNQSSPPSAVDDAATAMAEAAEEASEEEAPAEEASEEERQEESPAEEEAPAEEETPADEEPPAEKETQAEQTPAQEKVTHKEQTPTQKPVTTFLWSHRGLRPKSCPQMGWDLPRRGSRSLCLAFT